MEAYTSGEWHVKPGKEEEFTRVWQQFAEDSGGQYASNAWAILLRDAEDPSHFRSISIWGDDSEIAEWRGSDRYRQGAERFGELVDRVEIAQLEPVVSIGEVPHAMRAGARY
jgi:quinol monooxygenase YgiN